MIANVIQRGTLLYVYDEKGRTLTVLPAADGLKSFTAEAVNIQKGYYIYTYNAKGRQISITGVGR